MEKQDSNNPIAGKLARTTYPLKTIKGLIAGSGKSFLNPVFRSTFKPGFILKSLKVKSGLGLEVFRKESLPGFRNHHCLNTL